MSTIYITHCSAKKEDSLRGSGKKATPDVLYTAKPLQRFVKKCREKQVEWAIFSDKFGVVCFDQEIPWYDKHPNRVSDEEYQSLLSNFVDHLASYDKIYFYHNPGRFHRLYKKIVADARSQGCPVELISHLKDIG